MLADRIRIAQTKSGVEYPIIIEDWEEDYDPDNYAYPYGYVRIPTTDLKYHGNRSLCLYKPPEDEREAEVMSTIQSGLYAPQKGDTISFRFYKSAVDRKLWFGFGGNATLDNYYLVTIEGSGISMKNKNGEVLCSNSGIAPPLDEWCKCVISTTSSGGFSAQIYSASNQLLNSISCVYTGVTVFNQFSFGGDFTKTKSGELYIDYFVLEGQE